MFIRLLFSFVFFHRMHFWIHWIRLNLNWKIAIAPNNNHPRRNHANTNDREKCPKKYIDVQLMDAVELMVATVDCRLVDNILFSINVFCVFGLSVRTKKINRKNVQQKAQNQQKHKCVCIVELKLSEICLWLCVVCARTIACDYFYGKCSYYSTNQFKLTDSCTMLIKQAFARIVNRIENTFCIV